MRTETRARAARRGIKIVLEGATGLVVEDQHTFLCVCLGSGSVALARFSGSLYTQQGTARCGTAAGEDENNA